MSHRGGNIPKPGARDPALERPGLAGAVYLPKSGRRGPTPRWPLETQSQREKELWRRLWRTPAAVAWETMGWHDVVARYARVVAESEQPPVDDENLDWHFAISRERAVNNARAEARQLEDRLGLNPTS